MTAIAILHRDRIIQELSEGRYLVEIARDLGLKGKGQSISDYLADDPEYKLAREMGLEAKLAKREQEVEFSDKDDVPRARELLSHARWRAERECPARWGKAPSVVINTGLSMDAALGDLADQVLDKMRVVSEQSGGTSGGTLPDSD